MYLAVPRPAWMRGLTAACVTTLCALTAASAAAAATSGREDLPPGRDGVLATTEEADCYEVTTVRSVPIDKARALVPDRYTLAQTPTTTARMWIINIHCDRTSVDDHPPQRTSTTTYVGIRVSARKATPTADPTPTGFMYLLSIATNNPVLFAHYRAAGLPVQFDRRATSSETVNADNTSTLAWAFTAEGLDYTVSAQPAAQLGALEPSTTSYWYDNGPRGDLRIRFENLATVASRVHIVADFSDASTVASLLTEPRFEDINAVFGGNFIRGGWTGHIELLD